jgi:carboxymethylenebutenolidase
MNGSWIAINSHDSRRFDAYLSLPPTGIGPGLLLLQEAMGVTAHIRAVADQWASDGFVVLAPDMYWRDQPHYEFGYSPEDEPKLYGAMAKLDMALAIKDMASTVSALRARKECSGKVASLGFCLGGLLSYYAAADADVDAAVCYYPGRIHESLANAASISAPMHFHFGDHDIYIPQTSVAAVKSAFDDRDNVRIDSYPANHGFNCWERADYHQRSAALARGRSLAFIATAIC